MQRAEEEQRQDESTSRDTDHPQTDAVHEGDGETDADGQPETRGLTKTEDGKTSWREQNSTKDTDRETPVETSVWQRTEGQTRVRTGTQVWDSRTKTGGWRGAQPRVSVWLRPTGTPRTVSVSH